MDGGGSGVGAVGAGAGELRVLLGISVEVPADGGVRGTAFMRFQDSVISSINFRATNLVASFRRSLSRGAGTSTTARASESPPRVLTASVIRRASLTSLRPG